MEGVVKLVSIFLEATVVIVKMVIIYIQINWTVRVRKRPNIEMSATHKTKRQSYYVTGFIPIDCSAKIHTGKFQHVCLIS